MKKLYKGKANSPASQITITIGSSDTVIPVENIEVLPDAPNIAILGNDESAETIIYAEKTKNSLSGVTRGVEGIAKEWPESTIIARRFTNYDHEAIIEWLLNLQNTKASEEDFVNYVTKLNLENELKNYYKKEEVNKLLSNKVDKIDGKGLSDENYTSVEKNKLKGIETNANNYKHPATHSASMITETNTRKWVSPSEKEKWNSKADKDTTYSNATTSKAGLMSSTDKTKLDGIETGAEKNTITSVQGRTGAVTISKSDVGLGNVNDVAITAAQVTKINELNYTRAMTQAQYDALSTSEKNRTDVWYGIYEE